MHKELLIWYERQLQRNPHNVVPVIRDGIYDTTESLGGLIERLSDWRKNIHTIDYINLVTKYTVAYIFRNEHETPASETLMNHTFGAIGDVYEQTFATGNSFSDPLEHQIYLTKYQLAMLWDIAKSIAIIKDIVERRQNGDSGEKFIGLDLWSGSGILALAQYIQARRRGFRDIEITGIEGDMKAMQLSNRILASLGAGKVVPWNTADSDTYRKLGLEKDTITFISSENLPCPRHPFLWMHPILKKLCKEPQFANVQALRRYFQEEALKRCGYFPHIMSWSNFKSHTAIEWEGNAGYRIDYAQLTEEISTEKNVPRDDPFYPTTIFPIGISNGVTELIIPLEEVGKEYLITRSNPDGYIYPIENLQKRWHK